MNIHEKNGEGFALVYETIHYIWGVLSKFRVLRLLFEFRFHEKNHSKRRQIFKQAWTLVAKKRLYLSIFLLN